MLDRRQVAAIAGVTTGDTDDSLALQPAAHRVAIELIQQTMTGAVGYTARDVLAHPGCVSLLTGHQAIVCAERPFGCAAMSATADGRRLIEAGQRHRAAPLLVGAQLHIVSIC
jgi:hypothetical protein